MPKPVLILNAAGLSYIDFKRRRPKPVLILSAAGLNQC